MESKQGECVNSWLLQRLISIEMEEVTHAQTHANTQTNAYAHTSTQARVNEYLCIHTHTHTHKHRLTCAWGRNEMRSHTLTYKCGQLFRLTENPRAHTHANTHKAHRCDTEITIVIRKKCVRRTFMSTIQPKKLLPAVHR